MNDSELVGLESRLREMNKMAKIIPSENANVPIETVLNLSAFNLDQVLKQRPTFLEPEYPFEWTGVYSIDPGRFEISFAEGPDPTMSLVVITDQGIDDMHLRDGAEKCVRLYAESPLAIQPGDIIPPDTHVILHLESAERKLFYLQSDKKMTIGLFAQHTAEEFDIKLINADTKSMVPFDLERTWAAEHEHDDAVGSFSIEMSGDIDAKKLDQWLVMAALCFGILAMMMMKVN